MLSWNFDKKKLDFCFLIPVKAMGILLLTLMEITFLFGYTTTRNKKTWCCWKENSRSKSVIKLGDKPWRVRFVCVSVLLKQGKKKDPWTNYQRTSMLLIFLQSKAWSSSSNIIPNSSYLCMYTEHSPVLQFLSRLLSIPPLQVYQFPSTCRIPLQLSFTLLHLFKR